MLGVKPNEFDEYSLSDLWSAYFGYMSNQEYVQRGAWERARMTSYFTSAPHTKKIKRVKDVIVFNWEKNKSRVSKEDIELVKKLKERGHPMYGKTRN